MSYNHQGLPIDKQLPDEPPTSDPLIPQPGIDEVVRRELAVWADQVSEMTSLFAFRRLAPQLQLLAEDSECPSSCVTLFCALHLLHSGSSLGLLVLSFKCPLGSSHTLEHPLVSLHTRTFPLVSTGPFHTRIATPSEFAINKSSRMNDIVSSLLLQYGSSFAACVAGSFFGTQLTLAVKTAHRAFTHTISQSALTL